MRYLISLLIIKLLLFQEVDAQDKVAYKKSISFSDDGSSYFISEAIFDTSASIFPFKFNTKEFDIQNNYIKTISISDTCRLVAIKNDSIAYLFSRGKRNQDELIEYNLTNNRKADIVSLPYIFDYLNSVYDYNAKNTTLTLFHKYNPDTLFIVDLTSRIISKLDLSLLSGKMEGKDIVNIGFNEDLLSVTLKTEDGFSFLIYDTLNKVVIYEWTHERNEIKNIIVKINKGHLIIFRGYVNAKNASLEIVRLASGETIDLKEELEIGISPHSVDFYFDETNNILQLLLTYSLPNRTIGTTVSNAEYDTNLNFEAYDIMLLKIPF